ncbi:sensor histidine kinase [Marinactinospora rubrisoli]|uniref:histidine kinase n=1 Tax=Marinactinospora rubrisoli TaxID=2715399 RepID=A0ABW2KNL6_9ACTN
MARIEDYHTGRIRLVGWSLAFTGLAITGLLLVLLFLLSGILTAIWLGIPFLALSTTLIRGHANAHRTLLRRWLGHPIPTPYRPLPTDLPTRVGVILTDPATWRDLAWLLLNGTLVLPLTLLPAALFAEGVHSLLVPYYWQYVPADFDMWVNAVHVTDQATAFWTIPQGILLLILYWTLSPTLLRGYAHTARWLLAPTEKSRLAARVEHLATSRADTVDAQASEVRRIERDLHDGAQARLVALGMSLGMAEQLLTRDPQSAQRMLAEARESTHQALTEIRTLVRGIHPPVLVERGLDGAVRALAVTQHLPVTVDIDLPGRPADPVESAAYFAIAELLTNAAKHAQANRAWVRINHGHGRLVIVVGDDGNGGATTTNGTGLTGIRRRLAAFDGTITIASPPGGPTIATMELPCALSSPKTSPSSATD